MGRIRRTIMIGALAGGATLATVGVAGASVSPTASPHAHAPAGFGDFGDFGGVFGQQPGQHKRDRETPRHYQDERRHHQNGRDYSVDHGDARQGARHQHHRHQYHRHH